jgi:putative flippase GtrA
MIIKFIGRLARLGVRLSFGLIPETLISFLIVGSLGVLVHLAVLNVAMRMLVVSFQHANLAAMTVAATFNYFINNSSTFREKSLSGSRIVIGYLGYLCITSLGMGISFLLSSYLYNHYREAIIAALGGILVGSVWNYFMSYNFVWKLLSNMTKRSA